MKMKLYKSGKQYNRKVDLEKQLKLPCQKFNLLK